MPPFGAFPSHHTTIQIVIRTMTLKHLYLFGNLCLCNLLELALVHPIHKHNFFCISHILQNVLNCRLMTESRIFLISTQSIQYTRTSTYQSVHDRSYSQDVKERNRASRHFPFASQCVSLEAKWGVSLETKWGVSPRWN